jgi:hypothetical protein
MRRRVPAVDFSHEEPPQELLRFSPSQPAPIGLHGRPEPWRPIWEPEDFASFLRARAAWRDTHTKPLPGLPPLERHALARLDLPRALVDAERAAPKAEPEWVARAEARRFGSGRGIGPLPEVIRPGDVQGSYAGSGRPE